jgi:hypothetical protein
MRGNLRLRPHLFFLEIGLRPHLFFVLVRERTLHATIILHDTALAIPPRRSNPTQASARQPANRNAAPALQ